MTKVHYLHMGPWPVFVGFTTDERPFAREVKRLKIEDAEDFLARARACATTHHFVSKNDMVCIITMQPPTAASNEQYAALLAHEALHVIQIMREELNRGLFFGDEAEAYLLQHIVQSCLQIAWDTGRERKLTP